jgi:hypothetical protein
MLLVDAPTSSEVHPLAGSNHIVLLVFDGLEVSPAISGILGGTA